MSDCLLLSNKLQDKLDNDLAWRKKEITSLLLHIETQEGEIQTSLIRGAITILYAHWEGYIKYAATNYLEFICKLKMNLSMLSINFCYINLGKKFPKETSLHSYKFQQEVFDYIQYQHQNELFSINSKETIKTRGNLTFESFQVIAKQLGLDISWYDTKKNFIDEKLLGLRNPIAHGEFRTQAKLIDDFKEIKAEILNCLENFKDLVTDAFENKKFLKQNIASTNNA